MRLFRTVLKWTVISTLSLVVVIWVTYAFTSSATAHSHSALVEEVPRVKVALVLGTSEYLTNGNENLYFSYRIQAAVALYRAGKANYFLVSGDNAQANYNEPKKMQQALVEQGIPAANIILDYAGFRTLDSVVRAQKVFGQDSILIVSQKFHNQRALYIAQSKGINAFGFDAQDVQQYAGVKTHIREYLARVKMMLDLYILHTKPKFLGEQVTIG
jgi:SanA protein